MAPRPSCPAAGPGRLCPERLSAALRNLHRPGDPGARAARARHPDRLAAPPDRPRDAIRCTARSARRCSICRNTSNDEPRRVLRGWLHARRRAGYRRRAPRLARRSGARPDARTASAASARRWCWRRNCAGRHRPPARAFPAHAGLGRALCRADRGLTWTVSAHAKDIWTTPEWEKREKLAAARLGGDLHRSRRTHLAALAPRPDKVALCYHGLDLDRFPAPPLRVSSSGDGSDPAHPVVLLSVGRAVEKKGYDDLLDGAGAAAARSRMALRPYRRRRAGRGAEAAGASASASTDGSSGAARSRSRRCSPPIARPICSCSPRKIGEGWRPRRPAQRADGGAEPAPGLRRDPVSGIPELIEDGSDRPAGAARRSARRWPRRSQR